MRPVFRPVRGFGVVGWILLPFAAALGWCALFGPDLRHELFRVLWSWRGEDFVWDVIRNVLWGSYLTSLTGVACGPITLVFVLAAMHIAPRRWAWWQWALISAWLVLNPYLCFEAAQRMPLRLAYMLGWEGGRPARVVFAAQVHGVTLMQLAVLALIAWRMVAGVDLTGSKWRFAPLALWCVGAVCGTLAWMSDRLANTGSSWTMPSAFSYMANAAVWHASAAALLIGSAWAARRCARAQPWRCNACGYDLRGLASGVCPECGVPA